MWQKLQMAINSPLTSWSAIILKKCKQWNSFCDLSPNWQRDVADGLTHIWTSHMHNINNSSKQCYCIQTDIIAFSLTTVLIMQIHAGNRSKDCGSSGPLNHANNREPEENNAKQDRQRMLGKQTWFQKEYRFTSVHGLIPGQHLEF